jgi:sugar phosphate isomerase/epimerase
MTYRLSAMDTAFYHSLGSYEFDAKCEMLAELGYAGIYPTLWTEPAWADVARLGEVRARHGIDVAGVYVTMEYPGHPDNARLLELVETIDGCKTIELAVLGAGDGSPGNTVANSDPAGDDVVIEALAPLLDAAQKRGITIALYPHVFCWLERTEDAVRLCEKIAHPNLGIVFSGWHWYVAEGANLALRVEQAAPYIRSLNICGTRRTVDGDQVSASIEPLDEGELDNFALMGLLRKSGYDGPVLLQHYSVAGDVYWKLKRSLDAFNDMARRLDAHADWADLRDDPLPLPSGAERTENEGSTLRYG